MAATHTVTSADGVTVAYESSGSGPALVIVNGALSTRQTGAPLAPLLDPDFTLYRYDRRGRGESSDAAASRPENEIQDLAAVVAATGETPFVFGQSSGAAIVLEAAASGVAMRGVVVTERGARRRREARRGGGAVHAGQRHPGGHHRADQGVAGLAVAAGACSHAGL
jgi:pimeloyl-ACP methyl ester carboxylesterase